MAEILDAALVRSGTWGSLWLDGEQVAECYGCQIKLNKTKEDVARCRTLVAGKKLTGISGTGTVRIYNATSRLIQAEAQALKNGDFDAFLALVRDSGRSSALYLQNVVPTGQTAHQELLLTIALCERILNGRGAVRVHGGGFGGTAQAFVPVDLLAEFQARTEAVLGAGSCHVLSIRPAGGVRLA